MQPQPQPRPPKQQGRRLPQDTFPITFPEPSTVTRLDAYPPEFEATSDLLVDPHGNIYCFVCQVSVPKGTSNLSQHLEGKRHELNDRRFTSPEQKHAVRQRYQVEALAQRAALPAQNANGAAASPSAVTAKPSESAALGTAKALAAPSSASAPATPAAPTAGAAAMQSKPQGDPSKMTRADKIQLLERHQRFSINKKAYLKELLAPSDNEDDDDEESIEHSKSHAGDDQDQTDGFSLAYRQRPFAPIQFKPPTGADLFFDSIAAESKPTETAAKIQEALSVSAAKNAAANTASPAAEAAAAAPAATEEKSYDSVEAGEVDEIQPNDSEGGGVKAVQLGDYIGLSNDADNSVEEQDEEAKRARMRARESMDILKDANGEELPPWLLDREATQNVLQTSDSSIALHFEILQFASFVSPTEAELKSRNDMVMMVESIVKRLWPASTAQVFGSYATGLYLPSSDIDICVMGTPTGGEISELRELAEAIRNVAGFAKRVNVLDKAKVPLVKIISRKTSMNCDICIGKDNGPKNVPVIKKYLNDFPALRPLLLVVKCFLKQRDLNEVFSGGLGSYTIFLLVVSHLQMLKYNFPDCKTNLGAVLQTFLQLYGRMFNICVAGIRVKDSGSYFDKFDKYETLPQETMRFSVEDPNDETNELGRNGFAAARVRKAFNNASMTLIRWRRDDSSAAPTPLNSILRYDGNLLARRTDVIADMEQKGLKPIRTSVSETKSGNASNLSRDAAIGENLRFQAADRRSSEGTGTKRPFTPFQPRQRDRGARDPRDRDPRDRDPRDRDPRDRDPRDRDPRDRDPRLAKRRRGNAGPEPEHPRNSGSTNYHTAEAGILSRLSTQLHRPPKHVNQNGTQHSQYQGSVGTASYGSGMVYGGQPGYNDFPPQQYEVSTPGYQYVGQQAPYGANGVAGQLPHPAQARYIPSHEEHHHPDPYLQNQSYGGLSRRGRGGKRKAPFFPRRGSYRGK